MTSRNWFFSLVKEDMKRRVWLIALTALILFFSFPVLTILNAGSINGYSTYQQGLTSFQNRMQWMISLQNGWLVFLIIVLAIVYGISGFSYLYSKSKVDFYHSIPVRREKLFIANFLSGFLILAVLYLVFLLMSIGLAAANGAEIKMMLLYAIQVYLVNLSFFLLLYATVVTAVMMTGNRIVTLLGTAVFFFYIPIMGALVESFRSVWLLTYWSDASSTGMSSRLSPLLFYLECILTTGLNFGGTALAALAVSLLISLFALWLYKKRPSEGAGKSLVFPVSMPIIRIGIVLCSGMGGAVFGWGLRGRLSWTLFFLLCGCVIAHCVIEIIYHADFKKLFSHPLQMAGCVAACVLLVLGFRYDVLGYDRYLPKAGEIRTVSIDVRDLDSWSNYKEIDLNSDYGISWNSQSRTYRIFDQMHLEDTTPVLQIASVGVDDAVAARKYLSNSRNRYWAYNQFYSSWYDSSETESNDQYLTVIIQFEKANGRRKVRTYRVPMSRIEREMEALYEQPEYKLAMYPLLEQNEDLAYVYYEKYNAGTSLLRGDIQKANALREAYCMDLMEQTVPTRRQEHAIATIRFVTMAEDSFLRNSEYSQESWMWRQMIGANQYPIYPSFKRTLACLAEEGVSPEKILSEEVIISGRLSLPDSQQSVVLIPESVALTPEEVAEVLPYMVCNNDTDWNLFRNVDASLYINVDFYPLSDYNLSRDQGANMDTLTFYFDQEELPELIEKKIQNSL